MDINRQQSVGLITIRPKNPQSDRKSDRLTMFRPKTLPTGHPVMGEIGSRRIAVFISAAN